MTVRGASLHHFDRAGVVDPIAHFVLIQSAVGDGRREVIEAGMQVG